jgi:alpha-glucosidase (family GH31 glycosyl hydrolase)
VRIRADPWQVTFTKPGGPDLVTRGPIVDGARAVRATRLDGREADVLLDDGRIVRLRVSARSEVIEAAGASEVGEAFAAAPGERLYGTGERSDSVTRNGRETENYVADGPYRPEDRNYVKPFTPPWAARDRDDATYYPVPWLLSSRGWGVLIDEDETSRFTSTATEWRAEVDGARLRLRVYRGRTPAAALGRFVTPQPRPSAPWAFGPWFQTGQPNVVPPEEERAITEAQVRAGAAVSVAETQMHYLPCGAHRGREDAERARADYFHSQGLARLVYFNPLLCVSYSEVFNRAAAAGVLQTGPGGTPFVYPAFVGGPEPAGFTTEPLAQFDFTAPGAEDFYAELVAEAVAHGADGWMEDFGESTPPFGPHNRYPTDYHCALARIAKRFDRPLVRFQRSGWTGAAACADVVWGGDPTTVWGYDGLRSAVTQLLSIGLSGVGRWGTDIGGYHSFGPNEELDAELLTRWMELGALVPVMRTKRSGLAFPSYDRPQVYDDGHIKDWQRLTALHTQLNRYLRRADAQYRRTGLPIARALVLRYPRREEALDIGDEYLLGDDLLVAPVLDQGAKTRKLWLPPGRWVDWWRSTSYRPQTRRFRMRRHARILRGPRFVTLPAPLGEPPLLLRASSRLRLLHPSVTSLYAPHSRRTYTIGVRGFGDALRPRRRPRGGSRGGEGVRPGRPGAR